MIKVNGVGHELFKDPITDDGEKKSAKGLLKVNKDLSLSDCVGVMDELEGELKTVYINGGQPLVYSLSQIRTRLSGGKYE